MKTFARKWLLPPGINQLLADAPPSLKRVWGGQSSKPEPIELNPSGKKAATLKDLVVAPYGEIVWVETQQLRLFGCAFTYEQSHHVRYFRDGLGSLESFFELHKPQNQMQAVMLDDTKVGGFTPVRFPKWRAPWSYEIEFRHGQGLVASHGSAHHGPVSRERLLMEKKRLDNIRDSVDNKGFLMLRDHDFLHFNAVLVDDSAHERRSYRVALWGGTHRASLLSHLGWEVIPMIPAYASSRREVRLSELSRWPGVLDGTFSEEAARAYFLAHFRDPTEELLPGW